jgi:hypothetical protein
MVYLFVFSGVILMFWAISWFLDMKLGQIEREIFD